MKKKLRFIQHLATLLLAICMATSGYSQNALHFDGVDDFVVTPYNSLTGNSTRTIEAWIKPVYKSGQSVIADMGSMTPGERFTLNLLNGRLRIEVGGAGQTGSITVADGQWHHIAVTYDNSSTTGKFNLYVDGVADGGSFDLTVPTNTGTGSFRIGARMDSVNYFSGQIDEVRLWNTARTLAQIVADTGIEFCTSQTGLVAYHQFNSGIPGGNNINNAISIDSSGLANNGQLIGFTLSGTSSNWVNGKVASCNPASCLSPTGLGVTNVSGATADFYWTQSNSGSTFKVEYGNSGFTLGQGTKLVPTNDTITLSGLSDLTAYDVYVKEICSATDSSSWSALSFSSTCTPLSGTYTVNKNAAASATNFTSFTDLATSLGACGVNGSVTVNVTPGSGVYNEQVEFLAIPGASSTNTVTINGNGVMLVDSGNVGNNYAAVLLNGTQHLIIDSLHIEKTASSNAAGLQFMGAADSNVIRNSVIKVVDAGTITSIYAITFSASATSLTTQGNNGNYNLIEGNEIIGGYFAVRIYGSSSSYVHGNKFIDNLVRDFRATGIYFYYNTGGTIKGNEVHRLNRADASTTSTYCIQVGNSDGGTEVSYNWVHDMFEQASTSTSLCYPFYINASDNAAGSEGLLFNNIVSNIGGNGTHYPIYMLSDYWKVYHNTLIEENTTASTTNNGTRMIYLSSSNNVDIKNNLFYMNRNTQATCHLIYINTSTSNITVDNNAYYKDPSMLNANFGQYGTTVATDFAAWQAINSGAYDQNSAEGNPLFADAANNDYTPAAAYFNNIGANLQSVVSDDYVGASRSASPDPGAIEFIPPPGPDLNVLNVYPTGAGCGSTTSIIVEFLNQGTDTVTSFTMNYKVNNVAQTGIPVTGSWPSGAIDSVIISGIPINGTSLTNVIATIAAVAPIPDTDPANNSGTIDWRQGYSGTYTLDQSAAASNTNFISFSSLANALNTFGVCGDVIVNVAGTANTYTDRIWLDEIPGVSSSATVTINGNGNNLEYLSTSSVERATVTLNGTDWVTIDSLNITALGSTTSQYGFGVAMSNNADHNTIRNCRIEVANDLTSTNYAGITITGSLFSYSTQGQSGNYVTIEGNTIIGGYYGLSCYGASADSTNGIIIRNNTIQDFYSNGVYANYHRDLEFVGNDIHKEGTSRPSFTTTHGARLQNGKSTRISDNKIHGLFPATTTSQGYYLHVSYMESTPSKPTLVTNNMVYNTESDGNTYGVYLASLNNTYIAHNTIVLKDDTYAGSSSTVFARPLHFQDVLSDVTFSNNIVYYDVNVPASATYMIYANTLPTTMENNVYYLGINAPGYFGYNVGRPFTSLQDWKVATGLDSASVLANPFFTDIANDDYTPQSMVIDGLGIDLTSVVPNDINGTTRIIPTDPGAIEFIGSPCTGFSGVTDTVTSSSTTVMWNAPGQVADIIWGPVGFMQASAASDTVHVTALDTSATITGMAGNTCYDYYIKLYCTSPIPSAPALMGPYTVCTECTGGGLNGTYTVGGTAGPTNFATLDSVINTLNGCGISGPVVFNMQGGAHNPVELGLVDGVSATNTIIFNGSANFGDSINGTNATAAVSLPGAQYVSFNGIHMSNTGYVVWMYLDAHHLSFDNCQFVGDTTSTASANATIVASNSSTNPTTAGNNVSHLSISNSVIIGGYYGANIYGVSSSIKNAGFEFINNTFKNQYYYGLRTYYLDSVLVEGNSVADMRNTSTSYAYYLYFTDNLSALSNEAYGVQNTAMAVNNSNYVNATTGSKTVIANNMLQSDGAYGLNVNTCSYTDVFHNSVSASGTYGMYLTGSAGTDIDIRNNIFENSVSGTALYVASTPANTTIDYNLYYSGGNIGNGQATLAAWQTAETSWNQNSIEATATNFVSTTDFHTVGTTADDQGDNTVGIAVDFDGDIRPASGSTTVDMGADEYTPMNYDVKADMIIDPVNGTCGDSNTSVSVIITNLGIQSVTNIGVTVNVSGAGTASISGTYAGTLASLASDTITISSFNSVVGGVFNLEAITTFTGDQDASNDTLRTSVSFKDGLARVPVAKFDTVCTGQYDTLYWPANSSDLLLQWETTTGDSLSINDTLVVGPLGSNDTSIVLTQKVYPTGNVGPQDHSFGNYGTSWNTTYGLYFDVTSATTLRSVDIYPTGLGVIEFVLEDANNNVLATKLVQVTSGDLTTPFTAKLDFNLPPGTDYLLRPGSGSTTQCTRNFTGGSYPYTLPGVLSITGNVFNNGAGAYYYYFYNWQLGGGCPRPDGTITLYNAAGALTPAFTETLQNPTQTNMVVDFDASSSVGATSYSWNFGDGNTGSGMTTSHTYDTNGTYTVTLVITGTCGTDSISKTITVSGIGLEENALSRSMNVYPNPAHTVLNIQFETLNQNAVIRITDVAGKEVMRFDETNINKYFSKTVDISKLSNGIYMLEISDDNLSAVRRLIKE